MYQATPQFVSSQVPQATKFNLYLKTHEMRELARVLQKIAKLPKKERLAWAREHAEIVQSAVDFFVEESNATLSELSLDAEVMELSKELVVSLRDAVDMAQGILHTSNTKKS